MKLPQEIIDLKAFDDLYYNTGNSNISDYEYDILDENGAGTANL